MELRVGERITGWRIVRSDDPHDPVLLNSLRSHYEMSEEPRGVERTSSLIHMGISIYVNEGVAHGTAQKFDKLGDYVARVVLKHGHGFNFAQTGHPLHLTVWGDPIKLRSAIADIDPVWD
jgi:hypothetical protein